MTGKSKATFLGREIIEIKPTRSGTMSWVKFADGGSAFVQNDMIDVEVSQEGESDGEIHTSGSGGAAQA